MKSYLKESISNSYACLGQSLSMIEKSDQMDLCHQPDNKLALSEPNCSFY